MSRNLQSILLLLVGGAVTRIAIDNSYVEYVRTALRPWLIVAGVALIAVAVGCLIRDNVLRAAGTRELETAEREHGHDHSRTPRVALLLLLPVLTIFVVTPGALGAFSARRAGGSVGARPGGGDAGFPALPAGTAALGVRDFSQRGVWDDGRTLTGRTVALSGFVTPRDNGGIYLTRMFISCCAADASPIKVRIIGTPAAYPANAWITITGSFAGVDKSDPVQGPIPILKGASAAPAKPPTNPYAQ